MIIVRCVRPLDQTLYGVRESPVEAYVVTPKFNYHSLDRLNSEVVRFIPLQ